MLYTKAFLESDMNYHTVIHAVYNVFFYIDLHTIHMYSGITSGRVLDGELLYTKILEVNFVCICLQTVS